MNITDTQAITFDSNDILSGIEHSTVTNPSRIYFPTAGSYLFIASGMFAPNGIVNIWPRINGVDVPSSNSKFSSTGYVILTVPYNLHINAGDYVEFIQAVAYAGDGIIAIPASTNPTIPATPSIILTINKVSDM